MALSFGFTISGEAAVNHLRNLNFRFDVQGSSTEADIHQLPETVITMTNRSGSNKKVYPVNKWCI